MKKFANPNEYGQIPKNCINFNFFGKHCRILKPNMDVEEKNCVVLRGKYCNIYK